VTPLRQHLLRHRHCAAWLIVAALLVKLLVPAGFMPVIERGTLRIEICTGITPVVPAVHAMAGMTHGGHGDAPASKPELPCAFAGVAMPSLAAVDPLLLVLAIAFAMRLVTAAVAPRPFAAPAFLRPPLRGPPALS